MTKKLIAIAIFILVFTASAGIAYASTSTDENLTINGTFRFTTSPVAGYVLTSDGTGLASWAAVTNYWQRNGTTISPATIGDKVGIGMTSPAANLQILTTDGTISFGDATAFPNKSASTDSGIGLYNLPGSVTPAYKMGLFTEENGSLLSYGINISQIGDRDITKTGAIFRMDTRATSPYFSVKRQAIGGSVEFSDIQISQAGDIGLGGWASDTNTFPGNIALLVRGVAVPGLVVQGASGQTADLTQWQSFGSTGGAAGPVLLGVNSNGALITPAATALTVTSGTTGAVNIDSGTTGALNFGTGANVKTITIGNTTGATAVNINSGTAGIDFGGHILTTGTAPTQTQSTGTATVSTGSTDFAGTVTSSTTSHTYVGVTFAAAYVNAPFCTFAPANAAAGVLIYGSAAGVYVTTATTYVRINHPASSTAAAWTYHCVGR